MRWCRKVALDTEGGEIRSIFFREYFCRLLAKKVFPEKADHGVPESTPVEPDRPWRRAALLINSSCGYVPGSQSLCIASRHM